MAEAIKKLKASTEQDTLSFISPARGASQGLTFTGSHGARLVVLPEDWPHWKP